MSQPPTPLFFSSIIFVGKSYKKETLANPFSINNVFSQKENSKYNAEIRKGEVQSWGNNQKIVEKSMFYMFLTEF